MDTFKKLNRFNTNSRKWDLAYNKLNHRDFLAFSIADSDYLTAPAIVDALKDRVSHGAFGYTFIGDEYYDAYCKWVSRRYHYEIKKEWVVPSTGIVTSIYNLISILTSKKGKIVVQSPVYNPFFSVIEDSGRSLILNKLINNNGRYEMDFENLEECFINGAKMFILCNPHNPVGRVWRWEELERLINLAKKYNVCILSDEIHCDFILNGNKFVSLGNFLDLYDRIIVLNAPSKTFNIAGLHISNMIIKNLKIRDKINKVFCKQAITCPNVLAISACLCAYTICDEWLESQIVHLNNNYLYLKDFFKKQIPSVKVTELEGTYLAWLDFSFLEMSGNEITEKLLDYGVILNSGCTYSREKDSFVRLNFACAKEDLEEGLLRIKKFVNSKK